MTNESVEGHRLYGVREEEHEASGNDPRGDGSTTADPDRGSSTPPARNQAVPGRDRRVQSAGVSRTLRFGCCFCGEVVEEAPVDDRRLIVNFNGQEHTFWYHEECLRRALAPVALVGLDYEHD